MTYQQMAAAVDTFLAERNVDPEDVLRVELAKGDDSDARVHTFSRVEGVDYEPTDGYPRHLTAVAQVRGVSICLVYVHSATESVEA